MREGVKVHNIHCRPKSYKLKLLRKLVVQQDRIPYCHSTHPISSLHTQIYISILKLILMIQISGISQDSDKNHPNKISSHIRAP